VESCFNILMVVIQSFTKCSEYSCSWPSSFSIELL